MYVTWALDVLASSSSVFNISSNQQKHSFFVMYSVCGNGNTTIVFVRCIGSEKYFHLQQILKTDQGSVFNISSNQQILLDTLQLATGAVGLFSQWMTAVVHGYSVHALGQHFG